MHRDAAQGLNPTSDEIFLKVHGPCGRATFATSQEGRQRLSQLTELLGRMHAGDAGARDALFAAAYAELRRLARARLREGARDVVLDTTCLVHESYLRFVSTGELRAEDRRSFFAYASQVMRSVIVDTARERIAKKRGGDRSHLTLSTKILAGVADGSETVLKVHEALETLEQAEPRLAQVAQMRYFGGYSEKEIAETLDLTERTVQRDWEKARLILAEILS
jgi:RNA polymerase sigma factor (TIGR02999 family)